MSDDDREAQTILRLVMSQKLPMPPDSAANAPEVTPAPDPQLFVRRGVELQVFDAKKKPKRKAEAPDKAVAAGILDAEPRVPK